MAVDVRDPRLIIHAVADRREISIQVIDDGPGVGDPENTLRPFISPKKKAWASAWLVLDEMLRKPGQILSGPTLCK